MRKPALLTAAIMLCVPNLGGCALIALPDPDDLAFSSIAVLYSNDRTDDTWPLTVPGSQINEKLLRIEFTTKFNLFLAAYQRYYNIWNRIDFCQHNTDGYLGGVSEYPGVYFGAVNVDDLDAYGRSPEILKTYGLPITRTFYAYLAVSYYASPNISHVDGEPPPLLYILEEKADNVCLRIGGGVMFGPTFRSNIVFIPKEVISNALAASR